MKRLEDVAGQCGVAAAVVNIWVEQQWLLPLRDEGGFSFSDADLARARLIADLSDGMGIDPESMPVVLSLLDQVHHLRRQVRTMAGAMLELPDEARAALCRRLLAGKGPQAMREDAR